MPFASTVRQPPRRRSARIAAAMLIALVLACAAPPRVEAYPCTGGQARSAECAPAAKKPKRKQAGEPNLVSLTVFVVALVGVLLIPINYARRSTGE